MLTLNLVEPRVQWGSVEVPYEENYNSTTLYNVSFYSFMYIILVHCICLKINCSSCIDMLVLWYSIVRTKSFIIQ